jgi:hypothetical protein
MCEAVNVANPTMSYVIDVGSANSLQLIESHRELRRIEKEKSERGELISTGGMAEDDDERVPALQAADVISWAARKRQTEGPLTGLFTPLEALFNAESIHEPEWQGFHGHLNVPPAQIKFIRDSDSQLALL